MVFPDQFNAAGYFIDRHINEGRGSRVAIEADGVAFTYGELFSGVNRIGNGLRRLGVRRGERVMLLLLDGADFAESFFGAIKIGAVPVPSNTFLKAPDYEYIANHTGARILIVSAPLFDVVAAIPRSRIPSIEHILVAGGGPGEAESLSELAGASSPVLDAELTGKDDPAFWLYSSGSTGAPKACVHLQHDMVVCSEHYAKGILGMGETDRCFSVSKLFFAYGLGNALYYPLATGAVSILFSGRATPEAVFKLVERSRPTLFFSVPSHYKAMIDHRENEGREYDMTSIRCFTSAGEALPASIFLKFKERFNGEILDGIGSTEALQAFITNRPGSARPGSSGQVIPGYEARVMDDSGNPVKHGEIGMLYVRNDAICDGYWQQPEKTKEAIQDGWLRTGDMYYEDDDGYFWPAGRADDMMKCSGMWVSPVEIEGVLLEHPAIREAAVVGKRDDDDQLMRPMAYIVLRDGAAGTEELVHGIRQFAAARLSAHKRPQSIEFLAELPKTATGKIQRFKLRELLSAAT